MGTFTIQKTYQQINEKIRAGEVVVVTAEEIRGAGSRPEQREQRRRQQGE